MYDAERKIAASATLRILKRHDPQLKRLVLVNLVGTIDLAVIALGILTAR